MTTPDRRTFATLDGLRGFAALAVMFYHAGYLMRPHFDMKSGYMAVDFFYILSGFVIAHAYEQRVLQGLSFWRFMEIRLIRFYPLYVVGLGLGVFAAIVGNIVGAELIWQPAKLVGAVALHSVFIPFPPIDQNFIPFPLNSPSWSLFFELFVNIVYALVALHLTTRRLLIFVAVSGVVLAVSAIAYGSVNMGWNWDNFWGGFPRIGFSFGIGLLLYRFKAPARGTNGAVSWLLIAALAFLLWLPAGRFQAEFDLLCVFVLFPAIVRFGAAVEPSRRWLGLFTWLGAISYAAYVLHRPILYVLGGLFNRFAQGDLSTIAPWSGFIFILLTLPLATVADRYFDRPTRTWIAQRMRTTRIAQPELR